jgi:hypothetical protein
MITYLEFDGYCPESRLKDEQVEMRLNQMDFWESEKTGLQMTVFPPYAAILQWRGEGKFKEHTEIKATAHRGLLLAKAQRKTGCEIFPDEKQLFYTSFDLDEYIHYLDESYIKYEGRRFNEKDPVFDEQLKRLANITKEQYLELYSLFNKGRKDASSKAFQAFHDKLYEIGLVFNFNWMRWYDGYDFLEDTKSDYTQLPLLKVSMFLTSIFRADRFSPGTIEQFLENGTIQKIIKRLIKLSEAQK